MIQTLWESKAMRALVVVSIVMIGIYQLLSAVVAGITGVSV